MASVKTGLAARRAANDNQVPSSHNLAPGYAQANLIILPSQHASDFRLLCLRNPVALPLLAASPKPGIFHAIKSQIPWLEDDEILARGCDLRKDAPKFDVYRDGEMVQEGVPDVVGQWREDHMAFIIGSSSPSDAALRAAGFHSRHADVPRYKTTRPLAPSGTFYDCHVVVSMRSCKASEIGRMRSVTSGFHLAHGEPIDWGWGAVGRLGIRDIDEPDWGDGPLTGDGRPLGDVAWKDDEVPVFWGSGVSARHAVVGMDQLILEGTVMVSAIGCNVVLDCRDEDVARVM